MRRDRQAMWAGLVDGLIAGLLLLTAVGGTVWWWLG
jgi:hypothetical protein